MSLCIYFQEEGVLTLRVLPFPVAFLHSFVCFSFVAFGNNLTVGRAPLVEVIRQISPKIRSNQTTWFKLKTMPYVYLGSGDDAEVQQCRYNQRLEHFCNQETCLEKLDFQHWLLNTSTLSRNLLSNVHIFSYANDQGYYCYTLSFHFHDQTGLLEWESWQL